LHFVAAFLPCDEVSLLLDLRPLSETLYMHRGWTLKLFSPLLRSVCLPKSARYTTANAMRKIAVLALAKTPLAFLAVTQGLPSPTKHVTAYPAVGPFSGFN